MEAVDLRPLSLGELLDRTFRLYRNHFLLFVGIMALPASILLPFNLVSANYQGRQFNVATSGTPKAPTLPTAALVIGVIVGLTIAIVIFTVVYSIAMAAASTAVSEVYLGRTATIRNSFRRIRGRFWRLIGVAVNVVMRVIGVLLLPVIVIGGGSAAIGYSVAGGTSSPAFIGLMVLGVFFGLFVGVILYVLVALRYAVCIPLVMLEDLGIFATIRRSVFLTRGRRGNIFLTILVAGIIAFVGAYVLEMPFTIAMMVSAAQGHWSQWLAFASAISGAIGSALTGPISMIAIVLLYYDSRIRKEAFDLQFMMNALDAPAAAPGPVSPVSRA